ncbi:hypothetical protein F9K33_04510 [bacterium]|nr:MAG: hypothetical protein F9K33_04510 [bacterium]
MRLKFICASFLMVSAIFSLDEVFPANAAVADSNNNKVNQKIINPKATFHFGFTYGRASFSTRTGVLSAFSASGYLYHVISQADPGAKSGQPIVYSVYVEGNLTKKILLGVHVSKTRNQKITGSNWIGALEEKKPVPVERFDVEETYSTEFINGTINYIILPVDFNHSRWEVSVGTGISYNKLKLSGMQHFERRERRPANSVPLDDTSASYGTKASGFGYLFAGSIDFYWSRFVSNQFKLEFRHTPSLHVPAQTYTYVTTRSRVRVTDSQTLKKHSIRYSGVILSISLRFHI